jgi:hypothetical protein
LISLDIEKEEIFSGFEIPLLKVNIWSNHRENRWFSHVSSGSLPTVAEGLFLEWFYAHNSFYMFYAG